MNSSTILIPLLLNRPLLLLNIRKTPLIHKEIRTVDEDEIEKKIGSLMQNDNYNNEYMQKQRKILSDLCYKDDGKAFERAANEIIHLSKKNG
jgi:hypothetical protein